MEDEEDGLSCLSVYLSQYHSPPYTPTHTVTFAFLISSRIMRKWEKNVACYRDHWFDALLLSCCLLRWFSEL